MDNVVLVGYGNSFCSLYKNVELVLDGLILPHICQRQTIYPFHYDESDALLFTNVVNLGDVRMIKLAHQSGFSPPFFIHTLCSVAFIEKFNCHCSIKNLVDDLENLPGSTLSNFSNDLVLLT